MTQMARESALRCSYNGHQVAWILLTSHSSCHVTLTGVTSVWHDVHPCSIQVGGHYSQQTKVAKVPTTHRILTREYQDKTASLLRTPDSQGNTKTKQLHRLVAPLAQAQEATDMLPPFGQAEHVKKSTWPGTPGKARVFYCVLIVAIFCNSFWSLSLLQSLNRNGNNQTARASRVVQRLHCSAHCSVAQSLHKTRDCSDKTCLLLNDSEA